MKYLFKIITAWQTKTFGVLGSQLYLDKLKEELFEVEKETDSNLKLLEYADCFIVLFGAVNADGFTMVDLQNSIIEKYKLNKASKFNLVDGVFKREK